MHTLIRYCTSHLHLQQQKNHTRERTHDVKTDKMDMLVANVCIVFRSGGQQTIRQLQLSSIALLGCQCSDSLCYVVYV